MKRMIAIVLGALVLGAFSFEARALNGAQVIAYSATTEGLAGAGAAAGALDSSTMITNPAGLAFVTGGTRLGFLIGLAHTTFQSAANPAAGNMKSNDDPVLLPSGTLVLPLWEGRITMGLGAFGVAAFGNDYAGSRATPAITGNAFDTHTLYGLMKIVSAAAVKINDQLSVGLAAHLNRQTLESNMINAATLAETAGGDRTDGAIGGGVSVGVLYKPFSFLHVGASYTSEQFFDNFERYTDVLPRGLNYPQQANFGVAVFPIEPLAVYADFRWINWSGPTGGFGDSIAAGGLGWRDQFIGMGGVQYRPWDPLILRIGYNYGRSAVGPEAIFANGLSSGLGKQHLTGGVGIRMFEKVDVDLSYLRAFRNRMTDDGSAPSTAAAGGTGSILAVAADQISIDLTVRF